MAVVPTHLMHQKSIRKVPTTAAHSNWKWLLQFSLVQRIVGLSFLKEEVKDTESTVYRG